MKASALLGALVAAQLAAGLAIQALVLSIVGVGADSDAFVAAQMLPMVLLSVVSVSLQAIWQPTLSVMVTHTGSWRDNLSAAQGQVLVSLGTCFLVLIVTARWWVSALFPGFTQQQHDLVFTLTGVLLLANVFSGHSALYVTALRSKEGFILAESIPLGAWLISIVAIVATVPEYGVIGAAWVTFGRAVVTAVALHVFARAPFPNALKGLRHVESWRRVRPLLSGSALYKTVPIVDRYWSSQAGAGAMTIYNLAQLGMSSVATILDRSLSIPNTPRLARLVESRDWLAVRKTYRITLLRISIAVLAIAVLLLALKGVWPDLVFLILKIPASTSSRLWVICVLMLGYLYVSAAGGIVVATFYAMGDTKTSMRVSVIGFPLAIALKSVLFLYAGLPGLAFATSMYFVCNMIVLWGTLERRIGRLVRQATS